MTIIEPPTRTVPERETVAALLAAAYLAEQDLPAIFKWTIHPGEDVEAQLLPIQDSRVRLQNLAVWGRALGAEIQTGPSVRPGKVEAWVENDYRAARVRVWATFDAPDLLRPDLLRPDEPQTRADDRELGSNPLAAWLPPLPAEPTARNGHHAAPVCTHCFMPIRLGPPAEDGSGRWVHVRTDFRQCGDGGSPGPYAQPAMPFEQASEQ